MLAHGRFYLKAFWGVFEERPVAKLDGMGGSGVYGRRWDIGCNVLSTVQLSEVVSGTVSLKRNAIFLVVESRGWCPSIPSLFHGYIFAFPLRVCNLSIIELFPPQPQPCSRPYWALRGACLLKVLNVTKGWLIRGGVSHRLLLRAHNSGIFSTWRTSSMRAPCFCRRLLVITSTITGNLLPLFYSKFILLSRVRVCHLDIFFHGDIFSRVPLPPAFLRPDLTSST